MPRIAEFFGIVVSMFYKDHAPPHFHAAYNEYEATITIDPIRILEGSLPRRVQSMVFEWAALNQAELREEWDLACKRKPLKKLPPLE
jgi:hypothetical protein